MADANAKPKAPEQQILAGAASDASRVTLPYVHAMGVVPNPDPILTMRGSSLKVWEEVLRDDQVYSTFQQRRLALISKPVEVLAGGNDKASKAAADFLRECIEALNFDRICNRMAYAIFYGYGVGECIWARDGRHWTLDDIRVRRARRFAFDKDGGLRLERTGQQWELMPERKFWTIESGADNDDNPYGQGLAHWLYWPAYFKRHGLKFWLIFLEKFGTPTTVGKYPNNASKEDQDKLLAAAAAVVSQAAVIIPDGMKLELLEATRGGSADQATFHRQMNAAISKVVLGQTMTTDDGSSLSQSEVHMEVREELTAADADLQCGSFNQQVAEWLTEWNYPGARTPIVRRRVEPVEDLNARAERDERLYNMGIRPTPDYVRETYGEGFVLGEAPAPAAGAGSASFAEAADDAVQDFLERGLGDVWEPAMAPIAAEIRAALDGVQTLDQARAALARLIGSGAERAMAELLAQTAFAGRATGRLGLPLSDLEEDG